MGNRIIVEMIGRLFIRQVSFALRPAAETVVEALTEG